MDEIYYQKYLKYKSKYLELQKLSGGIGKGAQTITKKSKQKQNIFVSIMNRYDRENNNRLKKTINEFIKLLNDEQKKQFNILSIPEDHIDIKYIDEELKDFQLFRYKIYNLLINDIPVNLINFEKINILSYHTIIIFSKFIKKFFTDEFESERDIFSRLIKLNLNSIQLEELLKLDLDKSTLDNFLNLNLPKDNSMCQNSICDISPNIINWLRYKPNKQVILSDLLNQSFNEIKRQVISTKR